MMRLFSHHPPYATHSQRPGMSPFADNNSALCLVLCLKNVHFPKNGFIVPTSISLYKCPFQFRLPENIFRRHPQSQFPRRVDMRAPKFLFFLCKERNVYFAN
ncbi:hypothetical protein L596_022635 [Steinernema carpocapsae]|uniref:Uncharacterized protein n=1 Tax=Steinernema carpocapsae TaxID=34508 RepID=A0A4U5MMD2_STECR|nr:hypothetical protein L596_022635 [Steinernema carpocapsae]